jgi:hypothetical protein
MRIAVLVGAAALVLGGPAAAETWQAFSRSASNAFMADADSIVTVDGITSIRVATVPRAGEVHVRQQPAPEDVALGVGVGRHGDDPADGLAGRLHGKIGDVGHARRLRG